MECLHNSKKILNQLPVPLHTSALNKQFSVFVKRNDTLGSRRHFPTKVGVVFHKTAVIS